MDNLFLQNISEQNLKLPALTSSLASSSAELVRKISNIPIFGASSTTKNQAKNTAQVKPPIPATRLATDSNFVETSTKKTVECDHCNKKFSKRSNLNIHIEKEHKLRKYSCPYCNRNLNTKFAYLRHVKNKSIHPKIDSKCLNADEHVYYLVDDELIVTKKSMEAKIVSLKNEVKKLGKQLNPKTVSSNGKLNSDGETTSKEVMSTTVHLKLNSEEAPNEELNSQEAAPTSLNQQTPTPLKLTLIKNKGNSWTFK